MPRGRAVQCRRLDRRSWVENGLGAGVWGCSAVCWRTAQQVALQDASISMTYHCAAGKRRASRGVVKGTLLPCPERRLSARMQALDGQAGIEDTHAHIRHDILGDNAGVSYVSGVRD